MDQNHFIGEPPVGEVFIGYERGQWPLDIFRKAEHAANWLMDKPSYRYVWRYELTDPQAMELIPRQTIAATLKPRGS